MSNQKREKLLSVSIHGKDYVQVNERIRYFRESKKYDGWRMVSEFKKLTEMDCIIQASIYNDLGELVATGYSHEVKASSHINKTSYIENCETSAWGRALGNLGIGVYGSVASAEEVAMAIDKQNTDVENCDAREDYQKDPMSPHYVLIRTKFRGQCISVIDEDDLSSYYLKSLKDKEVKHNDWIETKTAIHNHLENIQELRDQYETDIEEDT